MAVLLEADGQVRLAGAVARVAEHLVQHQLFVDARLQSQDILITDQSVHPYGILHRFGVIVRDWQKLAWAGTMRKGFDCLYPSPISSSSRTVF